MCEGEYEGSRNIVAVNIAAQCFNWYMCKLRNINCLRCSRMNFETQLHLNGYGISFQQDGQKNPIFWAEGPTQMNLLLNCAQLYSPWAILRPQSGSTSWPLLWRVLAVEQGLARHSPSCQGEGAAWRCLAPPPKDDSWCLRWSHSSSRYPQLLSSSGLRPRPNTWLKYTSWCTKINISIIKPNCVLTHLKIYLSTQK